MKAMGNGTDRTDVTNMMGLSVCLLVVAMMVAGCGTVVPERIEDKGASWDGTNMNSGFIGYLDDGSGVVTDRARERYNALIVLFQDAKDSRGQKLFAIRPVLDEGVTPGPCAGTWRMTPEALSRFAAMNRWRKGGTP